MVAIGAHAVLPLLAAMLGLTPDSASKRFGAWVCETSPKIRSRIGPFGHFRDPQGSTVCFFLSSTSVVSVNGVMTRL